eukprot:COSAG06_NODE_118_length_23136_cov_18.029257_7_plen_850_part_00
MDAAPQSHGKLVRVSPRHAFQFHLVFSNKTESDAFCLGVWDALTTLNVAVWQQKKNIPKDSDNWFNEWFPSANVSIKIVCFLTAAYLKSPYCMKEFGIALAMDKLLVVACEPMAQITAVNPSEYPHASNALAYLMGGGQVIFHDTDDVVAEILKFLPREIADDSSAAQPEPEPSALSLSPVPAAAAAADDAWPEELAELVAVPAVAACLAEVGIHRFSDFAENFDTDEGHDKLLLDAVAALPTKPKKNKVLKIRMQKVLADLLLRFRIFEELDVDGDCTIDKDECGSPAAARVVAKAGGGTLLEHFDAVASRGSIDFAAFIANFAVSEGEGVPPADAATVRAAAEGAGSPAQRAQDAEAAAALAARVQAAVEQERARAAVETAALKAQVEAAQTLAAHAEAQQKEAAEQASLALARQLQAQEEQAVGADAAAASMRAQQVETAAQPEPEAVAVPDAAAPAGALKWRAAKKDEIDISAEDGRLMKYITGWCPGAVARHNAPMRSGVHHARFEFARGHVAKVGVCAASFDVDGSTEQPADSLHGWAIDPHDGELYHEASVSRIRILAGWTNVPKCGTVQLTLDVDRGVLSGATGDGGEPVVIFRDVKCDGTGFVWCANLLGSSTEIRLLDEQPARRAGGGAAAAPAAAASPAAGPVVSTESELRAALADHTAATVVIKAGVDIPADIDIERSVHLRGEPGGGPASLGELKAESLGGKVVVEGLVLKKFRIEGASAAELIDCTVQGSSGFAVEARSGASLTMRGGAVRNSGDWGVTAIDTATVVRLHGVTVEGSKGYSAYCSSATLEMEGGALCDGGDDGLWLQGDSSTKAIVRDAPTTHPHTHTHAASRLP